jgi:hypothetical protein
MKYEECVSDLLRRSGRRLRLVRTQAITEPANGLNHVFAAKRLELLPKAPDVYVHRAMSGPDVSRPRARQKLVAAENAPLVFQQEGEQAELGRREIEALIANGHAMQSPVENDRAGRQAIVRRHELRASEAGIEPDEELIAL